MPIKSTKRQAYPYYRHGFDQSTSPSRENTAVRETDRDVRMAENGWMIKEQPVRKRFSNPAPASPPSGGGGGKKPPKGPTGYGDNDDRKNKNWMYKNKNKKSGQ